MEDPQVTMVVSILKWSSVTWRIWGITFLGNLRIRFMIPLKWTNDKNPKKPEIPWVCWSSPSHHGGVMWRHCEFPLASKDFLHLDDPALDDPWWLPRICWTKFVDPPLKAIWLGRFDPSFPQVPPVSMEIAWNSMKQPCWPHVTWGFRGHPIRSSNWISYFWDTKLHFCGRISIFHVESIHSLCCLVSLCS